MQLSKSIALHSNILTLKNNSGATTDSTNSFILRPNTMQKPQTSNRFQSSNDMAALKSQSPENMQYSSHLNSRMMHNFNSTNHLPDITKSLAVSPSASLLESMMKSPQGSLSRLQNQFIPVSSQKKAPTVSNKTINQMREQRVLYLKTFKPFASQDNQSKKKPLTLRLPFNNGPAVSMQNNEKQAKSKERSNNRTDAMKKSVNEEPQNESKLPLSLITHDQQHVPKLRLSLHSRIKSMDSGLGINGIGKNKTIENKVEKSDARVSHTKSQSKDFTIRIHEVSDSNKFIENMTKVQSFKQDQMSPQEVSRKTLATQLKLEEFNKLGRSELRLIRISEKLRRLSSVQISNNDTRSPKRASNLASLNRNNNFMVNTKGRDTMKQFQAKKLSRIIKDTFNKDQSDDSSDFKSLSSFSSISSPKNNRSIIKLVNGAQKLGQSEIEEIEKEKFDNGIFEAIFSNDIKRLKELVNSLTTQSVKQRMLNVRDKFKRTAIFYAVYYNNYEMVNFLLSQGAETMFSDEKDRTVLHYCCIIGVSKAIMKLILDVNTKLDQSHGHCDEALDEYSLRRINKHDMPPKQKQQRHSIMHKQINAFGDSILKPEKVPNQPLSSLLPKKKKGLDIDKLNFDSKVKDDLFDNSKKSLREIDEEDDRSDSKQSQYSSRLQSLAVQPQKQVNSLLLLRRATMKSNHPGFMNQLNNPEKIARIKQQLNDPSVKEEEERRIKKTKAYNVLSRKFINLADCHGKTALHYAVNKQNTQACQLLLKSNAIPMVRDYKSRKPVDIADKDELKDLLKREETMFEEKFSGNALLLRKSMVLDNFDKLKNQTQSLKEQNKKNFDCIEEDSEESSQASAYSDNPKDEVTDKKKSMQYQRMSRRLQFNKAELTSLSDELLTKFCIGIYKDNSLTLKIRFEDRENFHYLLVRGIPILQTDLKGNHAVHYAILLEKPQFLSYLFEGVYESEIMRMCGEKISYEQTMKDFFAYQQAKPIYEKIRRNQCPWITQAFIALERSNFKEGNTCVHMAIDQSNNQIFYYILCMLKIRDQLKQLDHKRFGDLFQLSSRVLEFQNKYDNTALLFAAKRNQSRYFQTLVQLGANLYTHCNKFMNALHYAVLNDNQMMIEQIVQADAESDRLLKERNFRDETPDMLDDRGMYDWIFHHIWEAASIPNNYMVERIDVLLKQGKYHVNQKTLVGCNTPLHFAVIYENLKAIEYLCRHQDIHYNERNSLGQTPADLAMLIPKRKVSAKIVDYLNKKAIQNIPQFVLQKNNSTNVLSPTNQLNLKKLSMPLNSNNVDGSAKKRPKANSISSQSDTSQWVNHYSPSVKPNSPSFMRGDSPARNLSENFMMFETLKFRMIEKISFQLSSLQTLTGSPISTKSLYLKVRTLESPNTSQASQDESYHNINYTSDDPNRVSSKLNTSSWDQMNIDRLLLNYNAYLECIDFVGVFNIEIFSKWKQQLIKQDEQKKQEIRDLFKQIDVRKRGIINIDYIKQSKKLLDTIFLIDQDKAKFLDHLERQYQETKITEAGFVKMVLNYVKIQ